jgi:hypothetical protein
MSNMKEFFSSLLGRRLIISAPPDADGSEPALPIYLRPQSY